MKLFKGQTSYTRTSSMKLATQTIKAPSKYETCEVCSYKKKLRGESCERCLRQENIASGLVTANKHAKVLRHRVKKLDTRMRGAFDIETTMESGEFLGGYVGWEDETYVYCESMAEMLTALLSRPNTIMYAHYACNMELNYIINEIVKRNLTIQMIKQGSSRIIGMIIDLGKGADGKNQSVELRDSFALMAMSLKKAAELMCGDSDQKADHDFGKDEYEKRKDARGQIAYGKKPRNLKKFEWEPNSETDREYCRQDVQTTMAIVKAFRTVVLDAFGVEIGWTASSTAMNVFQAMIPEKMSYWRMSPEDEVFCRDGYSGGYVYTGKSILKHKEVESVDRNAAYVAVMREELPVGKAAICFDYTGKYGMYKCRVTPNTDIQLSIIPCRSKHGLLWPRGGTGTFNGNEMYSTWEATLTHLEIEYGRSHGYDIKVIEGREFSKTETPLKHFSEKIEELVLSHPEWKPVLKLVGNGLYGKFGTKLEIEETMMSSTMPGPGWEQCIDDRNGLPVINIWVRSKPCDAAYIMPHWAAYICARQRLWVFDTVFAVGVEHVHYCDTDSVKADKAAIEAAVKAGTIDIHKSRYGACKVDESYDWFQTLGPKVYWGEYTDAYAKANKCAKSKKRAKGIPGYALMEEMYQDVLDGNFYAAEFESWVSSGVRLKNPSLPIRRASGRKLTNIRESKTRHVNDAGQIIMPLVYDGLVLDEIA